MVPGSERDLGNILVFKKERQARETRLFVGVVVHARTQKAKLGGLPSEFKAGLGSVVRLCLKKSEHWKPGSSGTHL